MTRRTGALLGLASLALLTLLAGVVLMYSGEPASGLLAGEAIQVSRAATANGTGTLADNNDQPSATTTRTAVVPRIVMPAADVPAVQVVARLASAAKAGNVAAACRIAVDLQDCARSKSQLATAESIQESIRTTGATSKMIENITGDLLAASDRLEKKCAGITDAQLEVAFDYQLAAARGDPGLGRWLIANPLLDRMVFMDHLDQWQRHGAFADAYLTAALKQPDADNLPLLIASYKPRTYPSMELVHREDPAMFLALVDIARDGGAPLPSEILEQARAMRSDVRVVEAASRRRSSLEDAGWGSVAFDRSDFTPGPLVKPTIEQCSRVP